MASMEKKSKVLVIGALQHIAKFVAIASVKLGHPTLALLPNFHSADPNQNVIIKSFIEQGVTLFKGDINNHSRLVQAIRVVDVVIWAAERASVVMDCTKIIAAIKEAGNITRFIPLGLPVDVDRTNVNHALERAALNIVNYCEMRRFVEQSGVPYTYVVANFFAGFVFRGSDSQDSWKSLPLKFPLYGNGNTKVVFSVEKDVGTYTVLAADDPRTLFKTLYIRPPENVISLEELMSLWESKINRFGESIYICPRNYISEEQLLNRYREAEPEGKFVLAFLHSAFIRGDHTNYEIDPSFGVEASQLYPHVQYTTMNEYLNRFLPYNKRGEKK